MNSRLISNCQTVKPFLIPIPAVAAVFAPDLRAADMTRSERPNILWIIAEDIGPDFGYYGDPDSRTPRLDKPAAEGRMDRNAYSTGPRP